MTKKQQIFKCEICGNIIEILHSGAGQLVCCDQPMKSVVENSEDAAEEKHVPVIERSPEGILVKIGSTPHPMEEKHYIEWVQVIADKESYRKFLSPGNEPEALFRIEADNVIARAYCNIHGLWKS
ncbi:MAG: desulfoferrodoxin [bacterium]